MKNVNEVSKLTGVINAKQKSHKNTIQITFLQYHSLVKCYIFIELSK